jgi:NAD+ synthase (glutamine-hydrolysing)
MKIALAQINPTVGDITANSAKIKRYIRQAAEQGAELTVFSELALIGYPPKDLLLRNDFIDDNIAALKDIARECGDCGVLIGYACRHKGETGKELHNAAGLLHKGKIEAVYSKQLLPTYDVFDERRYFEPARTQQVVEFRGLRLGLSICEDIWQTSEQQERYPYDIKPLAELAKAKVDVVLNMSASPFTVDKHTFRCELFSRQCRQYKLPLIYVNQVGGNDELIFDGCSCAFDKNGKLIAQAKDFAEDLLVIDIDNPAENRSEEIKTSVASIHDALVLGLRDYAHKCGFQSVVLGLSGGIDSAVTAALAVEAMGKENVVGVAMPSRYSSEGSLTDAQKLAQNLGIKTPVVPIEKAHVAMEEIMREPFAGRKPDITEENIQARIRGNILMALSNKFGHLLLTTGNKSELAVGYCTMYGDMAGGLAVISDVPKTMVYKLAHYINRDDELIPDSSITKPPSAELRPDQKDQDSLPPYEQLDEILQRYVEQRQSPAEITTAGFDKQIVGQVVRMVDRNEYKRKQAAPGLKVTSRAFGSGRRMPIAQNYVPSVK